jgi:hypothetical protein
MKPLSSIKTELQPLSQAFFDPRPLYLTPAGNGLFIPLSCPSFGLLAAPAQASQQVPHMTRMVPYLEMTLNHLHHTLECPQLCVEAFCTGTYQQDLLQSRSLPLGQPGSTPRMGFALQRINPSRIERLLPPVHRRGRGLNDPRHFPNALAFFQQSASDPPPHFQFCCTTLGSHTSSIPDQVFL